MSENNMLSDTNTEGQRSLQKQTHMDWLDNSHHIPNTFRNTVTFTIRKITLQLPHSKADRISHGSAVDVGPPFQSAAIMKGYHD